MITSELQWHVAKLERAEAVLERAILDRMDVIARRMNLDEIIITRCGNECRRGSKIVESRQINELDVLYCDNIHEGEFEAVWTPEKGWDA